MSPKSGLLVPCQSLTVAAWGVFAASFVLVEPAPEPSCTGCFAGEFTGSSIHTSFSQLRTATDIYTVMILLVLLNGTGYGSLKCGRSVYLLPSYVAWCEQGTSLLGTIFRRSPAVTTLGYCNAAYGQGIKKSGNLLCPKANPALQLPANSNHQSGFAQCLSVLETEEMPVPGIHPKC